MDALNIIFNASGLEVHIMTVTPSRALVFNKETTERNNDNSRIGNYLLKRSNGFGQQYNKWIMWDVAIIEALIHPAFAQKKLVDTPPENTGRKICVYTSINPTLMEEDFWKSFVSCRNHPSYSPFMNH